MLREYTWKMREVDSVMLGERPYDSRGHWRSRDVLVEQEHEDEGRALVAAIAELDCALAACDGDRERHEYLRRLLAESDRALRDWLLRDRN